MKLIASIAGAIAFVLPAAMLAQAPPPERASFYLVLGAEHDTSLPSA